MGRRDSTDEAILGPGPYPKPGADENAKMDSKQKEETKKEAKESGDEDEKEASSGREPNLIQDWLVPTIGVDMEQEIEDEKRRKQIEKDLANMTETPAPS